MAGDPSTQESINADRQAREHLCAQSAELERKGKFWTRTGWAGIIVAFAAGIYGAYSKAVAPTVFKIISWLASFGSILAVASGAMHKTKAIGINHAMAQIPPSSKNPVSSVADVTDPGRSNKDWQQSVKEDPDVPETAQNARM